MWEVAKNRQKVKGLTLTFWSILGTLKSQNGQTECISKGQLLVTTYLVLVDF